MKCKHKNYYGKGSTDLMEEFCCRDCGHDFEIPKVCRHEKRMTVGEDGRYWCNECLKNLDSKDGEFEKMFTEITGATFVDVTPQTLKAGDVLVTNTGDSWLVLKVVGDAFVQDAFDGKWSTQSKNYDKETVVYVWDGKYLNKRGLSEISNSCKSILGSDLSPVLDSINNSY